MKIETAGIAGGARGSSLTRMVMLATAFAVISQGAHAQSPDARAVLKSMSDYVSSQKTIELTFDSDIEVITSDLEKLQFASSGEVLLSRPNKLRAHRVGGYADVELFFNGKQVSIFGRNLNGYAQFDATGTLDQLFEALRSGHGVALPGADLLMSAPYDVLMAGVVEANNIGRGVIDGVECEHLAFRNFDTDWQLWVQLGDKPIPRKMVITSKTLAGAPQYTLRVKSWKTGGMPAPAAFTFVPPTGAVKLGPDALIQLDELPPPAPAGASK